jgi:hypothetical protein
VQGDYQFCALAARVSVLAAWRSACSFYKGGVELGVSAEKDENNS